MNLESKQQLISSQGSENVIDKLEPFVTDLRKARIDKVLGGRLSTIELAIEAPSDVNNALAAVRSAEAFGISKVHFIAPEGDAMHAVNITRGAIYWVQVVLHDSLNSFLQMMVQNRVRLAGATPHTDLTLSEVTIEYPICIFLGNELRGLSTSALQACEVKYKIPMFGMTESLNLSVSAAISLYDMTSRKRLLLNSNSDLSMKEYQELKALYYLNSVAPRLALGLLKNKT